MFSNFTIHSGQFLLIHPILTGMTVLDTHEMVYCRIIVGICHICNHISLTPSDTYRVSCAQLLTLLKSGKVSWKNKSCGDSGTEMWLNSYKVSWNDKTYRNPTTKLIIHVSLSQWSSIDLVLVARFQLWRRNYGFAMQSVIGGIEHVHRILKYHFNLSFNVKALTLNSWTRFIDFKLSMGLDVFL